MLCVLLVDSMSIVVMLALMCVMSPLTNFSNMYVHTVVNLCTLGVFDLGVSLISWIMMTICMCVVIKQLEAPRVCF